MTTRLEQGRLFDEAPGDVKTTTITSKPNHPAVIFAARRKVEGHAL